MPSRRFIQCDVFSPVPTLGNALAVVVDGSGLSTSEMQRFAAWTNLAETTFLLPPEESAADYRLRIFTPLREMPFAGHPTLGSCAAWLHCGGIPRQNGIVRQQCGIGLVEIGVRGPGMLEFIAPPTRIRPLPAANLQAISTALELPQEKIVDSVELDNGPVFQVLELDRADTLSGIDATRVRWPAFRSIGLIAPAQRDQDRDFEVRLLARSSGMAEDPITGSLNAALACWLRTQGRLDDTITVAQGSCIGRRGRVVIRPIDDNAIGIAGQTHILIDGKVKL